MIEFAQSNVTEGESFAMIDRRIQSTKSVKEIEARDGRQLHSPGAFKPIITIMCRTGSVPWCLHGQPRTCLLDMHCDVPYSQYNLTHEHGDCNSLRGHMQLEAKMATANLLIDIGSYLASLSKLKKWF